MIKKNNSRIFILLGAIGYLICLMADFILDILPGGRLTGDALKNFDLLVQVTEGVSPARFVISGILGVISMIFIALGMIGIFAFLNEKKTKASYIVLVSGVGSAVLGAVYHIICTSSAWLFVYLKQTSDAFQLYQDFISSNSFLMTQNGILYTVMAATLFIMIILKKTELPRWACLFNVVLLYFVLSIFNIPGSTSIGGLVMCMALFILINWKSKYESAEKK